MLIEFGAIAPLDFKIAVVELGVVQRQGRLAAEAHIGIPTGPFFRLIEVDRKEGAGIPHDNRELAVAGLGIDNDDCMGVIHFQPRLGLQKPARQGEELLHEFFGKSGRNGALVKFIRRGHRNHG